MSIQTTIKKPEDGSAYGDDFALWALHQAKLLKDGRFSELDIVNLVDEVQSLGTSQRSELESRLIRLIEHLLKYRHGRNREPSNSWRRTIREQRRRIDRHLRNNPGLRSDLSTVFEDVWQSGVYEALSSFEDYEAARIHLYESEMPEAPDFSVEDALDKDFFPFLAADEG